MNKTKHVLILTAALATAGALSAAGITATGPVAAAAVRGDKAAIRELIRQKADVNATVIPRPYRHQTKSGSPFSVARIISHVGLGRVIT